MNESELKLNPPSHNFTMISLALESLFNTISRFKYISFSMDLGNGLSNSNNFLTYDDCFTQKV